MKKAFTLIELLVVIAILAVLAAILFPVIARAKASAQQTTCLSNFKQFEVAFAIYGNDYDDTLINPGNYDRVTTGSGQDALYTYIKNPPNGNKPSVYLCPADTKVYNGLTILGSPVEWRGIPTTYSMNVFLQAGNPQDPDPDECFTSPADQLTVSWNGTPYSNESNLFYNGTRNNEGGVMQSIVADPSITDLLFESVVEGGDPEADGYVGSSQRGGDFMNAQGFFYTQEQADNWYVSTMAVKLQEATHPWHNGTNNYLFADGHAKGLHPVREGYDIAQHPQDNIWLVHDGRDGSAIVPGHC